MEFNEGYPRAEIMGKFIATFSVIIATFLEAKQLKFMKAKLNVLARNPLQYQAKKSTINPSRPTQKSSITILNPQVESISYRTCEKRLQCMHMHGKIHIS